MTNDGEKLYNKIPLSIEELKDTARKLQSAFTISNFDLSSLKVKLFEEKIGKNTYDAVMDKFDQWKNGTYQSSVQ